MSKYWRPLRLTLCALLAACQAGRRGANHPSSKAEWPALDEAFLTSAAVTLNFRLGKPEPLAILRDGSVLFRRTPPRQRRADLYESLPSGEIKLLASVDGLLAGTNEQLSAEESARRERTRTATSGVVDIDVDRSGARVLVPLGERVFVVERASGQSRELSLGAGYPLDPRISPDGRFVAFVRDRDLWVLEIDAGTPRKLTAHQGEIEYGAAEFVAQEELDRRRGYVWSPDSRMIAFQRTDNSPVDTIYVSDPRHPERAPTPFKYPRAGTNNATVDLGIVSIADGQQRWVSWDLARYPYLAKFDWPEHAPLSLVVLNRAQTELAMLAVDPDSGVTRELLHDHDERWLNLPVGAPAWLDDGAGFLWLTEKNDGWVLELHEPNGKLTRTLTEPSFGLHGLAGIDPQAQTAIVLASADPRQQHVFSVPLAGGAPSPLTAAGGVHMATAAHGTVVINSALREGGSSVEVVNGSRRHQLPVLAERPALVPTTEFESVELPGRTLFTAITRPRDYDPRRRYPVLLKVYAGPHVQTVLEVRDGYLLDQWYADAGFVVLRVDGRGTPNRGRDFERAVWKDLISVALTDQVAALQALMRAHPELDPDRVGVFGWSFGGYFSTLAVLLRPDVFKAAVAGAPVTDWSLYDTAYTERYMQTPAENPTGYAETSALTHASKLLRPLLLIHGVTDDNVHVAHTLAMIEALFAASKRAEVVLLSSTHMLVDPKQSFAREKLQVDFFREHLAD
jgi:dipeptidyl-peptidase-4